MITDVFESEDHLIVRYTVENRTRQAHVMGAPEVFVLQSPKSPVSLLALRHTQIDSDLAKSIRGKGEASVPIIESETAARIVQSGERKPGLLSLRFAPQDSQPAVLRVVFPSNTAPISITLVL